MARLGPQSLRRSGDFQKVFREGRNWRNRWGTLLLRRREAGPLRLGWSIRRSLGGAVVRNRVRRRLKEAFQRIGMPRQVAVDLVFIPAAPILNACFSDLVAGLREICYRAGLDLDPVPGKGAGP